jgi:hypothetical protein
LLIAMGVGGIIFVAYQQMQVRKTGMNVARAILSDILVPTPVAAGIVGLLRPDSEFPFLLLAIAASVGLFVLFSQSWSLVLHSIGNTDDSQRQTSHSGKQSTRLRVKMNPIEVHSRPLAAHATLEQPNQQPQRECLERIEIGEGGRLAAKERLHRLLNQGRHYQPREIPLRPTAQSGDQQQYEESHQEEKDAVPDKVVVGIAKDLAKGYAEGRPDSGEPIERKPE